MGPWIAAVLAGVCLGLAPIGTLPGHALWLLAVLALGRAPAGRPVLDTVRGATVGLLWYGLSLRWVAASWVDLDGSLSLPLLSWLGVTIVQAIVPAVGTGLAGVLLQRGWPRWGALPVAWIAASGLAPWVQPLPGGLAVYGAALQPLIWPAAWLGMPAFLAVAGVWSGLTARHAVVGLALLGLWFGVGRLPTSSPSTPELLVGVVQPDTGAFDGRRASSAEARAEKLLGLIDEAREAGAEIVVTPETSWPHRLDPRRPSTERALAEAFGERGLVVLGVVLHDTDPPTNSLLALDDGHLVARQDKIWLVPVSEQRFAGLGEDRFRAGHARVQLFHGAAGLICYEDLVPAGLRHLGEATWVLAASNDAWLGPGPGARQHENAARLGAVRSGRWLVRPTANGRSAVFDPHGRRIWSAGWVDGDVHPESPGSAGVVPIHPARPRWAAADLEPWIGGLASLLALIAVLRPARRRDPPTPSDEEPAWQAVTQRDRVRSSTPVSQPGPRRELG